MSKKKYAWLIISLLVVAFFIYAGLESAPVLVRNEEAPVVITLGEDLSDEQKQKVMDYFKPRKENKKIRYITVSNQEEKRYLAGVVEDRLIGSKAISSAYCELLGTGKGIEVETENITAITPFMYANALATAGIQDARVVVAAPFKVSGTAALTGIIKAFELARGEKLGEEAKRTAHQEVAESAELGQEIGPGNAEKIIYRVKQRVLASNASQRGEIRKIIVDVAADLNVSLAEADINRITRLMQNINKLDVSASQIGSQLQNLSRELGDVKSTGREALGWLKQFGRALSGLLNSVKSIITG